MKKFAKVAGAVFLGSFLAGSPAWALKPVQPHHTDIVEIMGKPVSATKVAKAFKQCGAPRGWKFTDNGSGKLLGQLLVRGKHYVAVDVEYSSKAYNITYRDSKNMKYDPAKNTIHNRYSSWVENLDNDVRFCLN